MSIDKIFFIFNVRVNPDIIPDSALEKIALTFMSGANKEKAKGL